MRIQFGNSAAGFQCPTFIIAEIGVNHNGTPEVAGRMIKAAAEAGADAVKFQKRDIDSIATRQFLDQPLGEGFGTVTQRNQREQLELSGSEHQNLKEYAEGMGLEYFASCWDRESVEVMERVDLKFYKIASADLTNLPLVRRMAETGKPIIMSTGMGTPELVELAVGVLRKAGAEFALMQCTSTYPSEYDELDLRGIHYLKREHNVPVGFSGHERGIHIPVAAVAMGADIIEKHLTLDRSMVGPDHAASLEPKGFGMMVRNIRDVEKAMGEETKRFFESEEPVAEKLRKSVVSKCRIREGEEIRREYLTCKGPGIGFSPAEIGLIVGKVAARDIDEDQLIVAEDVSWY